MTTQERNKIEKVELHLPNLINVWHEDTTFDPHQIFFRGLFAEEDAVRYYKEVCAVLHKHNIKKQ